jgi:transcriptional regulator with XRE-family HTH domain
MHFEIVEKLIDSTGARVFRFAVRDLLYRADRNATLVSNFIPPLGHCSPQLSNNGFSSCFGFVRVHSPIMGYEVQSVNPQMGYFLRYRGSMGKVSSRTILAANLNKLMATHPDLETNVKLGKKSGVGRSTVDRARRGESGVTLDKLEGLAAAFEAEPWVLLCPAMESTIKDGDQPTNLLALDGAEGFLISFFRQMGPDEKAALMGLAGDLAAGAAKIPDIVGDKPQARLRTGVVSDPASTKHK